MTDTTATMSDYNVYDEHTELDYWTEDLDEALNVAHVWCLVHGVAPSITRYAMRPTRDGHWETDTTTSEKIAP